MYFDSALELISKIEESELNIESKGFEYLSEILGG